MRFAWLVASTLVAFGCGDNLKLSPDAHRIDGAAGSDGTVVDTFVPIDAPPQPDTLAGTGLCFDDQCLEINPDALEYEPQFVLYADGASKRRWIELPTGTQIDTSNMDEWVFPVGTKIWKEFTGSDGTRTETRFITKVLADDTTPNSWFFVSYQWNAAQDAAVAVPNGVANGSGQEDIPSRSQCKNCHEKYNPRVLGFSAISLDFHQTAPVVLDLDGAIAANMLSVNPPGAKSPHYPLPGTAVEKAALSYMHANCGHCHNENSPFIQSGQALLTVRWETTGLASVATTPAFLTTVGVNGGTVFPAGADCPGNNCTAIPACNGTVGTNSCIIKPGDSADSQLFFRMTSLNFGNAHMPQTAVKTTDPVGVADLQTWITSLPH